jgi:hypothetical protein
MANQAKVKAKRSQLEAKGWSRRRIDQYLKDWQWNVGWTTNPKGVGKGSLQ